MIDEKWDRRFLALAEHVASWSKDPSTQTGAVIVRPDRTIASMGYNGFPRGIEDDSDRLNDRQQKYDLIVHCEMNAILSAREPLTGYTIYVYPFLTCQRCAVHIVQTGIKRVVVPISPPDKLERWRTAFEAAEKVYMESGIELQYYD